LNNWALCCCYDDRNEDGADLLRQCLETDPNAPMSWVTRAMLSSCLIELGRLDEAEQIATEVVEAPTESVEPRQRAYALQILCELAANRGDREATLELGRRAIAIERVAGQGHEALRQVADAFDLAGLHREAFDVYIQAHVLADDFGHFYRSAQSTLDAARIAHRLGEEATASHCIALTVSVLDGHDVRDGDPLREATATLRLQLSAVGPDELKASAELPSLPQPPAKPAPAAVRPLPDGLTRIE
jgi:tetratricopeptide (TPR) repeat protein